jgi:outer membrane protein OmpA-like peptidoglycan-associated protein
MPDVLFAFGRADLTSQARGVADDIAEVLTAEARNRLISVEGHTDTVGSDTYNQELSKRRAENVAQALEHAGVSSQRITAQGYGERYPVAPNTYPDGRDNPAGRAQNRRVEVVIQNS